MITAEEVRLALTLPYCCEQMSQERAVVLCKVAGAFRYTTPMLMLIAFAKNSGMLTAFLRLRNTEYRATCVCNVTNNAFGYVAADKRLDTSRRSFVGRSRQELIATTPRSAIDCIITTVMPCELQEFSQITTSELLPLSPGPTRVNERYAILLQAPALKSRNR